jgi:hypothetical protein
MAGKILITPNTGSTTTDPTIVYQGSGGTTEITQRVKSTGAIAFEGIAGTLLEITSGATGSILINTTTDNGVDKLQVNGSIWATNLNGINTGDQTITLTGDVTGTGKGSFAATLSNTGVTAGQYTLATVTVDAKGRVTAIASNTAVAGSFTLGSTVVNLGSTVTSAAGFNSATASKLATPTTINGVSFDGSAPINIGTPSPYYDIHNFINGKPLVNEILMRAIAVRAFNLAANCAGSYAFCTTPATASFQLSLLKNGAEFGTITFAIGSTTGTFSCPAATFNISDQFAIRCKTGVQDTTLSDIAISLLGTA